MAISYETLQKTRATKVSNALEELRSINETFQAEGINVLNEGFAEVATNLHRFEDYVHRLSEGLDPESSDSFRQLAENVRFTTIQESSLSNINPITALSLPMLRTAWPKTAVREGIPTEPVLQPKFKVTWWKPYMLDENLEKIYLPAAVKQKRALFKLKGLSPEPILVGRAGVWEFDLLTPVGANWQLGDEIDPVFSIIGVNAIALDANGANPETVTVAVKFGLDTNINVIEGQGTVKHSDGTESMYRVFAKLNRRKGLIDIASVGPAEVASVVVDGFLSSEKNLRATQVGFDITAEETTIGTGHPIESPINIQQMTDTMAMYNIDSTVRTLEIMSTAMAQSVDLEGIDFIQRCWELSNKMETSFSVIPPSNFTLGNTAWREELKIKIDNLITRMMQGTNITSGQVVIFGNLLDTQILSNIRWLNTLDDQPNGVNVEYKVGTYSSGIAHYKVLSSFNFEQGALWVVYLPSSPDHATVKYYPYSFNVVRGTASSNNPNIPAVQMLKRHVFKQYISMMGKINILDNNG